MLARTISAALRAILVGMVVALPALMATGMPADKMQIVALVSLIAAVFTFVEYNSRSPSLVEFREAPPFNRIRFIALAVTVFLLTVISGVNGQPTTLMILIDAVGQRLGQAIDFPYSPVRLIVLMLPEGTDPRFVAEVRTAAGIAYTTSIIALGAFVLHLRMSPWPARGSAFNLWTNLPTFEPTARGDVVNRLQRDASINLVLGFLLPFLIPAVVKLASDIFNPIHLNDPLTLIWTMTTWAFLPASLLMRGIALGRVAQMIEEQRRRVVGGESQLASA